MSYWSANWTPSWIRIYPRVLPDPRRPARRVSRRARAGERSRSAAPNTTGIAIDRQQTITSDDAIDLAEIPKSLAILGSGAVGVEFASIFRRFGSEVTLIELLP